MLIGRLSAWKNKIANKILLRRKKIKAAGKLTVRGKLRVYGTGNISFGSGVTVNSSYGANPTGGFPHTILYTMYEGKIRIGNNVGISNCVICSLEQVIIEDNVLIGAGARIYDTDFHPLDYADRVANRIDAIGKAPVTIGEGAFIGAYTTVLKGVTIGKHSVIGAGSVVTKSVPDGELWAGNPARFIKKLEA